MGGRKEGMSEPYIEEICSNSVVRKKAFSLNRLDIFPLPFIIRLGFLSFIGLCFTLLGCPEPAHFLYHMIGGGKSDEKCMLGEFILSFYIFPLCGDDKC